MRLFKKDNKQQIARRSNLMPGQANDYAFRRSRTLTGTRSSKVSATAERNAQFKTARLQAHELHGHKRRILRMLAGCGLAIAVIGGLLLNYIGTPVIATNERAGAGIPNDAYQQSLQEYFNQYPLQRFGLLLNQATLEGYMLAKHGELKQFDATTGFGNTTAVFGAEFRKPVLAWEVDGKRFFVDDAGMAFTYDYHQGSYVAVADQSGIDLQTGGAVASTRFIAFLGKMVGAVNQIEKGSVVSITIPATAREVDLRLQGRDYPIKTYLDREPVEQAEDVARALTWFDERKITPQMIDVRIAGRAFFR